MGYDMYREKAQDDENGYYRLNIFGMGEVAVELWLVGIVVSSPFPDWPDPKDFGLKDYPDEDEQLKPAEQAYLTACQKVQDAPLPGDTHGIPDYKFGSNDGWLVLPQEVKTGVAWADHYHPGWREKIDPRALHFVEWMEGSEEGFRVW